MSYEKLRRKATPEDLAELRATMPEAAQVELDRELSRHGARFVVIPRVRRKWAYGDALAGPFAVLGVVLPLYDHWDKLRDAGWKYAISTKTLGVFVWPFIPRQYTRDLAFAKRALRAVKDAGT